MVGLTSDCLSTDSPKNYFGAIKFVLKVLGINIDGYNDLLYTFYSIFVIIFLTILYPILDFLETFKHDFIVVAENTLVYLSAVSLATIETIVIIQKRGQLKKLWDSLEQPPFVANRNRGGDKEEKLIKECVRITTIQCRVYWIMTLLSILSAFANTLYSRLRSNDYHDWTLPYGPFSILNDTYSPNYEITWIYQNIAVGFLGMQLATIGLVTGCTLAHISYQFKIIQNNIKRILLISYEKMQNVDEPGTSGINLTGEIDGSIIPWKYLKSTLKEIVEYHLAIISLVDELERVFNILLLTTLLNTLAMLCSTVYHGSMLSSDDPRIFSSIGESMVCAFQIALVCYWGEQVVFQSEEVGTAVWESNFPGTDIRFQKCLVFMIRRSKNSSHLTAGKFTVIRLTTLVWVLRASYSAFMMLRSQHV